MAGKLVKRTLDIIKSGVDEKVKDYTSNWTQFTSDAREVKDILIKGETNAADTVQKLKRTGITKKISEWFYGAETEFESSGSDSEFDPGFSVESSSDGKLDGDKSSSALTYDSMKDLSAKQTGMMVKIGRRQTEQSVANTAEVISTINNRTAEMVAVMNNINTSLKGVNDRLDKLIKIQSLGIEAEEERALSGEGGLYDSNGMLSLKGVFDAARTTGSGKFGQALQALGMAKGNIGPEMLFGLALDSVLGRQRSSLGGKSVNELGKEFNEFIGNGIQTALTNVISSKTFKDLFGDITGFEADKNYGDLRNARYDTKRAQFDNMTRHSIVKIMPELLIKLNENLSGKSYHINQNGDIVEGPAKNYFNEAVNGAISGHNIKSNIMTNIGQGAQKVLGKSIPQEDLDKAADALVRYYVYMMHSSQTYGGRMLTKADISNPTMTVDAIGGACEMLGAVNSDPSKGYDYWSKVCQTILYKVANSNSMDANAFVNNINQSIRNMQQSASEFGRNSFYSGQAGKITSQILTTGFVERYGSEAQKNQISRSTTTTASKFTTADYVKGIFAILNRGVNVKIERGSKYRPITRDEVLKDPWQINSTDDTAAAQLFGALTGDKNAIKSSMESALGLLGTANNATGGRVGVLQTAANLTTMFNQGKGFFDNIRNKQLTQNLTAALHGDASALQAQVSGKFSQAKNAVVNNLPYGMTHDQRVIDAGHSIQGIGHNIVGHAQNLGHNIADKGRGFVQNTGVGQTLYRGVNNAMYDLDDRRLNAARNAITNYNPQDLSKNDQRRYAHAMNAFEQGKMGTFKHDIGQLKNEQARDYLMGKYDVLSTIDARRTNVQGNPDIGAVRMAAPDKASKEHGKMYNLVKGGFNITAKALGAIAKIVKSGLDDVYYGFGSAIQGMFGGARRNQQTGKMELHRGLIGDLTWGTMKTGAHYTKMALGAAGKLIGKVGGAIGTATQGIRDKWNAGDSGIYDSELDRNLTRAELNERRRGEIVSQNYEHRDKDGKWHLRAQRDDNGNKVVKQGSTVTRGDLADAPLKALGKTVMNCVGKLGAFGKGIVAVTKKLGGIIATPFKFAANIFKKSSFGKGFFEGFDKAKEAKNARKLEKDRNSSFSNSAIGKIMDEITGKTKDGPLQAICNILKDIEINTNPDKPTTDPNATGGGTGTNETQNGGTSEGNADTKGENKENKEKKDDSSDKGEGESGGEEKKKGRWASFKESASEKVGGAVNKFKGTEAGKLVTGTLENMGKVVGGMAQGVMGILKIAMGVLTAMEGFKAIQTLVEDIFKKGLKPLNQVFQKVYHMIKPLATQLTNIVKEIAKALTQMLDGVLKTLTPLLKMISDAISTIFETVLQPVMEILDATLSACMVPITLCLDAMKPALDIICNDLKIVSGVVQMGMGGIMGLLGGIGKGIGFLVSGVGHILKKFSRSAGKKLVNTGKDVSEAADNMLENAKSLMVNGAKQFKEGLAGQLTVVKKLVTLEYLDNDEEEKKETVIDEERANKINLSDAGANFGSGDVNNYNTWNYTYGSGNTMNQHTYGPTMNMAERGCGPVALADAYMRRTGSGMNPLTLAGAMMGNGSYEPNRGTSVASMVNTGRSLGMNMQVGGVTQRSLNGASPSNPITIMGSGSGFGTKRGNDHYLNVVGSDGRGNSYVSNPLNGRVSKTPTSQLALNSRLGLYGSGDKLPDEFGIDLDSMTALERLQSLSERFQKIFTGDSTVDKTKKEIDAGKNENMANLLEAQLGNLTEEQQKAILETARKAYDENGGFRAKRDGETEEEYQAARDKDFEKNKQHYINYAMNQLNIENASNSLEENTKLGEGFESNWDKMNENYTKAKDVIGDDSISDDIDSEGGSSSSGGNGTFLADNGVPMFNYGKPKYTDVQIHDWITESNHTSGHSPLHDFFTQTNDDQTAISHDGNWYNQESNPDNIGVGSSGRNHGGVDINWQSGSEGKKVLATTGGVVTMVSTNPDSSQGYAVKWRDSGDMYHWYMHLRDTPLVKEGDKIEGGDLLGYVGNTGASDGAHLHYTITKNKGGYSSDPGHINPLTYFSVYNPASAGMYGDTTIEHLWSYMLTNGYTPEAIAGFLGFIYGESGSTGDLDPKTLFNQGASSDLDAIGNKMREGNKEYVSNASDYTKLAYKLFDGRSMSAGNVFQGSDGVFYPDTGIAQWVGKNTEGLLAMGKQENIPWTNEGLQVRYFSDVYANSIKDRLNTAKSLEDAFEIAMYKNAGDPEQYPGGAAGFRSARLPYAKQIYEKYRNADITQWTGYAEQHAQSTIDSSKNNNNSYGYNGQMYNVGDPATRKNMYIRFYKDLSHIKATLTEDQYFSQFTQYLAEWPQDLVTEDAKELLTDDVITQYIENVIALQSDFKTELKNREKNISKGAPSSAYDAVRKDLVASKVTECRSKYGRNPYMWAAVKSSGWTIDTTIFSAEGVEPTPIDNSNGMTGIVNTQDSALNIRSKPDTSSDIIGTLDKGTKVTVAPTNDTSWYAYDYNGKQGYVSSNYIKLDQTGPTYLKYVSPYLGDTGYTPDPQQAVNNYNNTKSTGSSSSTVQDPIKQKRVLEVVRYPSAIRDYFSFGNNWEGYRGGHTNPLGVNVTTMEKLWKEELNNGRDYNYDGWIGFPKTSYPLYMNTSSGMNDMLKGHEAKQDSSDWDYPDTDTSRYVVNKLLNHIDDEVSNASEYISFEGNRNYVRYQPTGSEGEWMNYTGGMGDVSPEVPAVDMNKLFDETSQTMQNATNAFTGGTTVVVTRDDQSTADMITKLSEITFKVRNERVEELLEELVDYVKTTKKKSSTFNHVHGSNNYTVEDMFEDEIPEAVMRLSKGG